MDNLSKGNGSPVSELTLVSPTPEKYLSKPDLKTLQQSERMAMEVQGIRLLKLGFSIFPVNSDKKPLSRLSWKPYTLRPISLAHWRKLCKDKNAYGIALICGQVGGRKDSEGKPTNGLECYDFDLKHDYSKTTFKRFKQSVIAYKKSLWDSFVIEQTPSGGFHIWVRNLKTEGNKKLTYIFNPEKGKYGAAIETRGQELTFDKDGKRTPSDDKNGYAICAPSKGYNLIQNDFNRVPSLSTTDRLKLHEIFAELNEKQVKPTSCKTAQPQKATFRKTPKILIQTGLEKHLNQCYKNALNQFIKSADGDKHDTLISSSYIIGRYVGGGLLGELEAFQMLENAINEKEGIKCVRSALKDVRDGISKGITNPISFDDIRMNLDRYQSSVFAKNKPVEAYEIDKFIGGENKRSPIIERLFRKDCGRILLEAPTGSGKTATIMKEMIVAAKEGDKKFIFVLPLRSLTSQLGSNYAAQGVKCIKGGSNEDEIREARQSNIVVCTYDSLHKIVSDTNEIDYLIIDECHNLITQYNFRDDAINSLWKLARGCKNVIAISATPPRMFNEIGFRNISFKRKESPNVKINRIDIRKGSCKNQVIKNLSESGFNDGLVIVKVNNKSTIEEIKETFIRDGSLTSEQIACIYNHSELETDSNYISLINKELIKTDIRLLLTTSKINDGVNIKNKDIRAIHVLNERCTTSFIQFVARPREMDTINVFSYRSLKDDSKKTFPLDEKRMIRLLINESRSLCKSSNFIGELTEHIGGLSKLRSGGHDYVFYNNYSKQWEVNEPAILHRVKLEIDGLKTVDSFYDSLISEAPNFSVVNTSECVALPSLLSDEIKEEQKNERLKKQKGVVELMNENIKLFLTALFFIEQDKLLKGMICKFLGFEPEKNDDITGFIEKYFALISFKHATKAGAAFLRLHDFGIPTLKALELVTDEKFLSREVLKSFTQSLSLHTLYYVFKNYQHGVINPKNKRQLLMIDEDFKTLSKFKGMWVDSKAIMKALNATRKNLSDKLNPNQVAEIISLGYRFVKVKRTKAKTVHYLLTERITRTDFLNQYGIESEDFLNKLDLRVCKKLGLEDQKGDLGGDPKNILCYSFNNSGVSTSTRPEPMPYEGYSKFCGF